MKMRKNSIFAVLLRSPWWYSILIAGAIMLLVMAIFGHKHIIVGVAAAVPFLSIGAIAGYRGMHTPSSRKIDETEEAVRRMAVRDFVKILASAYAEDGYEVVPFKGKAAELQLEKAGQVVLVNCKRVKAANNGTEPLRALATAGEERGAAGLTYITLGAVSVNASKFAADNHIDILGPEELTVMLARQLKSLRATATR